MILPLNIARMKAQFAKVASPTRTRLLQVGLIATKGDIHDR